MNGDYLDRIKRGNFGIVDIMQLAIEVEQLRQKVLAMEAEIKDLKATAYPIEVAEPFVILRALGGDGR